MKAEQVDKALLQKFITDDERIVFWHDQDGEFADYVSDGLEGELKAVTVLDAGKRGGLPTKLLLEREDATGKYLVYSTGEQPPAEADWLLDIRLYSAEFHAALAAELKVSEHLSNLSLDTLKNVTTFWEAERRIVSGLKGQVLNEGMDTEAVVEATS